MSVDGRAVPRLANSANRLKESSQVQQGVARKWNFIRSVQGTAASSAIAADFSDIWKIRLIPERPVALNVVTLALRRCRTK